MASPRMNGAPLLSRRPAPDAIAARRTASGGKLQTLSMKFSLPPLSAEEQLTLSPWEKWQRYRRFPWKFLLQLVLLVLDAVEEQRTKAMSYGMSLLRLRAARAARAEGGIVHEAEIIGELSDRSEKKFG